MGDIFKLVGKRLGLGLLILLIISFIIFFMVELLPGDIAQAVLGQGATEENLKALRTKMGLDQPAIVRYLAWLGDAVTFDFGSSIVTDERVVNIIGERFANTLFLAATATGTFEAGEPVTNTEAGSTTVSSVTEAAHESSIFFLDIGTLRRRDVVCKDGRTVSVNSVTSDTQD